MNDETENPAVMTALLEIRKALNWKMVSQSSIPVCLYGQLLRITVDTKTDGQDMIRVKRISYVGKLFSNNATWETHLGQHGTLEKTFPQTWEALVQFGYVSSFGRD